MAAPLTVSVVQAAEDALFAWLGSQLAGIKISDEWPNPREALPQAGSVTILRAGQCQQTHVTPYVMKQVDPVDLTNVNSTFYWKVAACEQPLQLDVWTNSKPQRDDIMNRLADALTAGKAQTLSPAFFLAEGISPNQDPVALSISLQLAAPWDHLVGSYMFDEPETSDTARTSKIREFRGTYHGTAWFDRTTQRVSPRMTTLKLPTTVSPFIPPPGTPPTFVWTFTKTGAPAAPPTVPVQVVGTTQTGGTTFVANGPTFNRADATVSQCIYEFDPGDTDGVPGHMIAWIGGAFGCKVVAPAGFELRPPQGGDPVPFYTYGFVGEAYEWVCDVADGLYIPF